MARLYGFQSASPRLTPLILAVLASRPPTRLTVCDRFVVVLGRNGLSLHCKIGGYASVCRPCGPRIPCGFWNNWLETGGNTLGCSLVAGWSSARRRSSQTLPFRVRSFLLWIPPLFYLSFETAPLNTTNPSLLWGRCNFGISISAPLTSILSPAQRLL